MYMYVKVINSKSTSGINGGCKCILGINGGHAYIYIYRVSLMATHVCRESMGDHAFILGISGGRA